MKVSLCLKYRFLLLKSLFVMILLLSACIDSFRPELNKSDMEYQLVVEGTITDECGPFKVRLTNSASVYTDQDIIRFEPVSGAAVHISDDKGNDFHLYQGVNGWYETIDKCLQGIPGNTYTLKITESDGISYESTPQLMQEVPPIDSIFYEKDQRIIIDGETVSEENWLNILLNTRIPETGVHYFRWEFEETWEFKMPEYVEIISEGFDEHGNPYKFKSMITVDVAPEKLHCWITETSKSIHIISTANFPKSKIDRNIITSIGPEEDRLKIRYSILVKQYAINKEMYEFFRKLKDLNETNGGVYDKLPAPVYGNILCNNGTKKALGYFLASALETKRIFIDHTDVNVNTGSAFSGCGWDSPIRPYVSEYFYGTTDLGRADVWSANKYCTDCRERGTNVKPDFWQ